MQLNQLYGSRQRPSWLAVGLILLILGLVIAILGDWFLGWRITGLFGYTFQAPGTGGGGSGSTTAFYPGKTLWDLVELLLLPVVIGGGVIFLGWMQRQTQLAIAADQQAQADMLAEKARAQATKQKQLELDAAALEQYLALMNDLLLNRGLQRAKPDSDVAQLARLHTLAGLKSLNAQARNTILWFIYEAGLIHTEATVISLKSANLTGLDLANVDLASANMQGVRLSKANLAGANLQGVYLEGANLAGANLANTELDGATYDQHTVWPAAFNPNGEYLEQQQLDVVHLEELEASTPVQKGQRPE